jgi:hypothetical protein
MSVSIFDEGKSAKELYARFDPDYLLSWIAGPVMQHCNKKTVTVLCTSKKTQHVINKKCFTDSMEYLAF